MGVYIVLNPNFTNFEYKNLLPVLSAFFYAASMVITKYTSDKDNIYTQLFYFYLISISMSYSVGQLHKYAVDLYKKLEEETGQNVGFSVVSNLEVSQE